MDLFYGMYVMLRATAEKMTFYFVFCFLSTHIQPNELEIDLIAAEYNT